MSKFTDKVVIIVGASGKDNMGQCMARRFAAEGAHVLVSGRRAEPLDELAREIGCTWKVCDFTRKDDIDALVNFAQERYGQVDIGINATGWGLFKAFEENTEEDLQDMMDLQFKGPFQFMQALVKAMRQNPTPGGSIIMISSAAATMMAENHAPYMGTKAGTEHVVRCVANEYGQYGIRANSICPGITRTPLSRAALDVDVPEIRRAFEAGYPLGRIGTVDDIAEAALWLASDACFMTGQSLQVNGGLTLRRNPTLAEMGLALAGIAES